MSKKSKAIKPDKFFSNLPALTGQRKIEKKVLDKEERILGIGASRAFWVTLKNFMIEVAEDLDQVNEAAVSQGAGFEEIGKNTIVISLTKGIIKKIIDKVEDAKEAIKDTKEK